MYNLINTHISTIFGSISGTHVPNYDWLISNRHNCLTPNFQKRYKNYWRLNAARLNPHFCTVYFTELNHALGGVSPPITQLVNTLYLTATHNNGRKSLQYSFASKLLHTVNPNAPIYDSLIAAFYFFQEPSRKLHVAKRINAYDNFYNFLDCEYRRIITLGLLTPSINSFRTRFTPKHFTDEKIIDSLLWGFVDVLNKGAVINKIIVYP